MNRKFIKLLIFDVFEGVFLCSAYGREGHPESINHVIARYEAIF